MMYMEIRDSLNRMASMAHGNAAEHGFYDDIEALMDYLNVNDLPGLADIARRDFVLAQLAKICSEVGECVAVIQKQRDFEGLGEELADIAIRTADLAAWLGYEHGCDVVAKMKRNQARPRLHGKIC